MKPLHSFSVAAVSLNRDTNRGSKLPVFSMYADLILTNAKIITQDVARPRATALAISGGRFLRVGSEAEVLECAGKATRILSLDGHTVLPGLIDSHVHLLDSGAIMRRSAWLEGAANINDLKERLARQARLSSAPVVTGYGWEGGLFRPDNLNRAVLDEIVPDRPAFVVPSYVTALCANSAAIRLAGMRAEDFPPELVQLGPDGTPNGWLHGAAAAKVSALLPDLSDAEALEGAREGARIANRYGITSVLDPSVRARHFSGYRHLAESGEMTVRVSAAATVDPSESSRDAFERVSEMRRQQIHPLFRVHSAKFFLDGMLEDQSSSFLQPYIGGRVKNSPLFFEPEQINQLFQTFDAARFQLHIHATGDRAIRTALDGIQHARTVNGPWRGLHQVAHVMCPDPEDLPRFGQLGVVPNIQAGWIGLRQAIDGVIRPALGQTRANRMFKCRSLWESGAPLVLSSDWYAGGFNPFEIIESAVTRMPANGRHPKVCTPFEPDEALTRQQAVTAYTSRAAAAVWRDDEIGVIAEGYAADLVVIDRDLFSCSKTEMGQTEALLTLFEGRPVYAAGALAGLENA